MTVTTQDGSAYGMELRDFGSHGRVLVIARTGGPDDPPLTNKPMQAGRWYHVNVLDPLPPQIGTRLSMVVDPVMDDSDPIVRVTAMVTSVIGLVQPRLPPTAPASPALIAERDAADAGDDASRFPPRLASDAVAGQSYSFFDGHRKLSKTSALFAGITGLSVLLGGRHRR